MPKLLPALPYVEERAVGASKVHEVRPERKEQQRRHPSQDEADRSTKPLCKPITCFFRMSTGGKQA